MSLTVITPVSGGNFGPGFTVTWTLDTVGPFEPGSTWTLELSAPAGENVMTRQFVPYHANPMQTQFVNTVVIEQSLLTHAKSEFADGADGQLKIFLTQPIAGVSETTDIPVIIDRRAGANVELANWMTLHPPVSTGLTELQEEKLDIVQASVARNVGIPGVSDLISGIASQIDNPGLAWGSFSGAYELEGDGAIADLVDALQNRWGVYWLATTIPAGLGHVHGQSEEYLNRLVQFRTVHARSGISYVSEIADFNYHGALWQFAYPDPIAVEYSILPGVHLQVRWWQFP